jgi:hypothetical protein
MTEAVLTPPLVDRIRCRLEANVATESETVG